MRNGARLGGGHIALCVLLQPRYGGRASTRVCTPVCCCCQVSVSGKSNLPTNITELASSAWVFTGTQPARYWGIDGQDQSLTATQTRVSKQTYTLVTTYLNAAKSAVRNWRPVCVDWVYATAGVVRIERALALQCWSGMLLYRRVVALVCTCLHATTLAVTARLVARCGGQRIWILPATS